MKTTGFSPKSNTFPALFPVDVDTRLSDILKNAFRLLERNPEILEKIDQDLDAYALGKKKNRQATERIKDSKTVQYYFQTYGLGALPARTTIHDNVQAISFETREYILSCQHLMIFDEDLDDFSNLTLDSTAVRANSCWPTDSGIINDILHRSFKYSQNLDKRFGIPNFMPWFMETWLDNISKLHFLISVTSGKGSKVTRRSLYKELYGETEKAIVHNFSRMTIVAERKRRKELLPAA